MPTARGFAPTTERVPMVEFRANTQNFSEPTKELDAAMRAHRIEQGHGSGKSNTAHHLTEFLGSHHRETIGVL